MSPIDANRNATMDSSNIIEYVNQIVEFLDFLPITLPENVYLHVQLILGLMPIHPATHVSLFAEEVYMRLSRIEHVYQVVLLISLSKILCIYALIHVYKANTQI